MITGQDAVALSELSDIQVPLPQLDLDKISEIVVGTYEHVVSWHPQSSFEDSTYVSNNPLDAFIYHVKEQCKNRMPYVLDIGCGLGLESTYLASRDCEVLGIDGSQAMIKRARERAARMQSCTFQQMNMQQLQFYPDTFDAIWSARTLIHVPQAFVVDLLATWKRLLKPGGVICVSVVLGRRRGWVKDDYAQTRPMFNRYFVENELEQTLSASGFTPLECHYTEDLRDHEHPPYIYIIARKNDTHLNPTSYAHLTYLERKDIQEDVTSEQITPVIADYLKASTLTAREQVNLCVLYDLLAQSERENIDRFKLAAQKLKLHLQTPETLSSSDFAIWFLFGQLHLKLKQYQSAHQCFERSLTLCPGNQDALLHLSYCYEGLGQFDDAIDLAHHAEELANACTVNERVLAELYHALGHFYIGRSLQLHVDNLMEDREMGENYMRKACNIRKHGVQYLSCLAGIYNETKRYSETVRFLDDIADIEQFRDHEEELYNELHFYRGEACIGIDRYDDANFSFDVVERYARARHDWDAHVHVKLYRILMKLKGKDINDLELEEIQTYLRSLHEYEPSLYVGEAFKHNRDRLICILTALYMLKKCLNEQEPPADFNADIKQAITYMEKACDEEQQHLDLLVLTDHPGALKGNSSFLNGNPHLFSFDEIEKDISETVLRTYRVWAVLFIEKQLRPDLLAHISFLLGRFSHEGYTIYIYDPHKVLPDTTRSVLNHYFVGSIEEMSQFCYICVLYDKIREYLSTTRRPQGMAPIASASALRTAQAEAIWLLAPAEEVA